MAGGGVGVVDLVLIPHCFSWKPIQVLNRPEAFMALYLALHSSMVNALADVPHKPSAVTITRLRIILSWMSHAAGSLARPASLPAGSGTFRI